MVTISPTCKLAVTCVLDESVDEIHELLDPDVGALFLGSMLGLPSVSRRGGGRSECLSVGGIHTAPR